jgi:hypothetical protein
VLQYPEAVKEVAAGEFAGSSKATDAAPLLKGLSVPTSVAVTLIGANGSKKSFCARDFFPALLFTAIYISPKF